MQVHDEISNWKWGYVDGSLKFYVDELYLKRLTYMKTNLGKATWTDRRYFARSKFSKILVLKKNFDMIWQVMFNLKYLFVFS